MSVVGLGPTSEGADFILSGIPTFSFNGVLTLGAVARIDWGDGTAPDDAPYGPGSTGGAFVGTHRYADDGQYTITFTVISEAGSDVETTLLTVGNVAPQLNPIGNQTADEGVPFTLTNLGVFSDPGFDNPLSPPGATAETFTYFIDWDDGDTDFNDNTNRVSGSPGIPTTGTLDGGHTYLSAGTFVVTVRLADDDMSGDFTTGVAGVDFVEQTFLMEVEPAGGATTFVVDILADEDDGNVLPGDLSLREAIRLANENTGAADTIEFAPTLTAGGPATITLSLGELLIIDSVTITGPSAELLTIDASGNDLTPTEDNGDGEPDIQHRRRQRCRASGRGD